MTGCWWFVDQGQPTVKTMNETAMRARRLLVGLVCGVLGLLTAGGYAQTDPSLPQVPADVVRIVATLRGMSERIRLTLHLSTLGVLSPTQVDQRLYAGQTINYLVGPSGEEYDPRLGPEERFTGLLVEARFLTEFLVTADVPLELRERLAFVAKKVSLLLSMARDDAALALRARRLDIGADHMLRAFAFLNAALGRDSDPVHLGGVLALLRILPPVPPSPADRGP